MSRRLHPLIRQAKQKAETYKILQRPDGAYNLWRFPGWDKDPRGWQLTDQHRTRELAEAEALYRLALEPRPPTPVVIYEMADSFFYPHP